MHSRLTTWLACAQINFSQWAISKGEYFVVGMLTCMFFSGVFGCAAGNGHLKRSLDRSAAKRSFISWNLRAMVSTPRESAQSRAFRIASLSNRELYRLMETRPAPDLATIAGKWNGINKGLGSATMGLMQDVKVLEGDVCVRGYNILVKQVSINDLPCRGWQPELDPNTCKPKTMGNFVAIAPNCCGKLGHTVKLDYTIAQNPWYDPSRFLIDELVAIDDDILLGRATANIGKMHIPVAYFVLTRAPQSNCATVREDASEHLSEAQHSVLAPLPMREIVERQLMNEPVSSNNEAAATAVDEPTPNESSKENLDTESSASDKATVSEASEPISND